MTEQPRSSLPPDTGIDEAWLAEALHRLEEMENDTVIGVLVEDAITRARSAIK